MVKAELEGFAKAVSERFGERTFLPLAAKDNDGNNNPIKQISVLIPLFFCKDSKRKAEDTDSLRVFKSKVRYFTFKARMAFSTANTVTPTSANTAIHMVAHPKVANSKTAIFTPMAKPAF